MNPKIQLIHLKHGFYAARQASGQGVHRERMSCACRRRAIDCHCQTRDCGQKAHLHNVRERSTDNIRARAACKPDFALGYDAARGAAGLGETCALLPQSGSLSLVAQL